MSAPFRERSFGNPAQAREAQGSFADATSLLLYSNTCFPCWEPKSCSTVLGTGAQASSQCDGRPGKHDTEQGRVDASCCSDPIPEALALPCQEQSAGCSPGLGENLPLSSERRAGRLSAAPVLPAQSLSIHPAAQAEPTTTTDTRKQSRDAGLGWQRAISTQGRGGRCRFF